MATPHKPLRLCAQCGRPFDGVKEQRMCPACRAAARAATVLRSRTCKSCGATFPGGPRASYCPSCRAERQKAQSRECHRRQRAGTVRPIGSTAHCTRCGKPYTVTGGLQRYCPECAPVAVRETVNAHKREYALERMDINHARKAELTAQRRTLCAYCGKPYQQQSHELYCSPECQRELRRIGQAMSKYKAGKLSRPPKHERTISDLPQSDLPGVHYHRSRGKWEVVIKGKYHGVYQTQSAAEAVWHKLMSHQAPPDPHEDPKS